MVSFFNDFANDLLDNKCIETSLEKLIRESQYGELPKLGKKEEISWQGR